MKRFSLWLPLIYFLLMLLGLADETRILIFLISPPGWIVEIHWFVVNFIHPSKIPLALICAVSTLFWLFIGIMIDFIVRKASERSRN